MKTLHTVALATFAATAMWASTAMAELPDMSQPTNPEKAMDVLACRGGRGMTISMKQVDEQPSKMATTLTFTKSKTGGSRGNADLLEGQCAWANRRVEPHEPSKMTFVDETRITDLAFDPYGQITSLSTADEHDETSQLINYAMHPERFYVQAWFDQQTRTITIKKVGLE